MRITRSALSRKAYPVLAILACGLTGAPALGAPEGRLRVLPQGYWQCGTPGDALGTPFQVEDAISFAIVPNSSYLTRDGRGVYLLTEETLTFTRGPLKGRSFHWESRNRLRSIAPEEDAGRLICNRRAYRGDNPFSDPSEAGRD